MRLRVPRTNELHDGGYSTGTQRTVRRPRRFEASRRIHKWRRSLPSEPTGPSRTAERRRSMVAIGSKVVASAALSRLGAPWSRPLVVARNRCCCSRSVRGNGRRRRRGRPRERSSPSSVPSSRRPGGRTGPLSHARLGHAASVHFLDNRSDSNPKGIIGRFGSLDHDGDDRRGAIDDRVRGRTDLWGMDHSID